MKRLAIGTLSALALAGCGSSALPKPSNATQAHDKEAQPLKEEQANLPSKATRRYDEIHLPGETAAEAAEQRTEVESEPTKEGETSSEAGEHASEWEHKAPSSEPTTSTPTHTTTTKETKVYGLLVIK
jgi:hypothetical protein